MSGISIAIDDRRLREYIALCTALGRKPQTLLAAWGQEVRSEAVGAFQRRGLPGDPRWPDKPPHWAHWEGGRNVPLTFRGRLAGSIVSEVQGESVRTGSPLDYAATHQLGDPRPRAFYVHIEPELEQGVHGMRVARFPNGYPKGRLVLRQAFSGESTQPSRSGRGRPTAEGRAGRRIPRVVRVLVRQRSIRQRRFLPYPPSPQLMERLYNIAAGFLLGPGGRRGA